MISTYPERDSSLRQALGFHVGQEIYNRIPLTPSAPRFLLATITAGVYFIVPNIIQSAVFKEKQNLAQKISSFGVGAPLDAVNYVGSAVLSVVALQSMRDNLGLEIDQEAFKTSLWLGMGVAKLGTNALNNYLMDKINHRLASVDL